MNSHAPVLDLAMADQWFSEQETEEDRAVSRRMVGLLRNDIGPRLAALAARAGGDPLAHREVHSLRGAVGSIGLAACANHLHHLEKNWTTLPDNERATAIARANEDFQSGLAELFRRFPDLAT